MTGSSAYPPSMSTDSGTETTEWWLDERKPSKEQMLKRYRDRVGMAISFRKKEQYDDLWRRLIDLYRGKHFPDSMSSEDRIAVNIAFSTINVIAPSVAVNYPSVTVLARKPEDADRATVTFRQNYRSDVLKSNSRKTLVMVRSGGRWHAIRKSDVEKALRFLERRGERVPSAESLHDPDGGGEERGQHDSGSAAEDRDQAGDERASQKHRRSDDGEGEDEGASAQGGRSAQGHRQPIQSGNGEAASKTV